MSVTEIPARTIARDPSPQPNGPVQTRPFVHPWHARIVALVVALNESGHLDHASWHDTFLEELQGAPESEDGHYHAWLAAVERVLSDRGMIEVDDLPAGVPLASRD